MAQFKEAVLTRKGIALLAKAQAEEKTIAFTRAVTGSGEYEEGEDLASRTELKNYQQEFAPTTIQRQNETNVYVRFSITNNPSYGALTHGYYVTEIGLMANDPDEGEILYGIAIADEDKADYLPAYNNLLPAVIGVDFLIEVDNAESVTIMTDLSAYATNADLNAKADHIAWDDENNKMQLKANGEVISECVISFDDVDLAAYAKKAELKVSYDAETEKLALMHGEELLAETPIHAGGGGIDGSLATEEEVQELGEELIREAGGTVDDNARVAEPDEVEQAIENLDNI